MLIRHELAILGKSLERNSFERLIVAIDVVEHLGFEDEEAAQDRRTARSDLAELFIRRPPLPSGERRQR